MKPRRMHLRINGIVQGVGFRPFAWRLARRHALSGWVANVPGCVVVEIQGDEAALSGFVAALRSQPPPLAVIERVTVEEVPADESAAGFQIRESSDGGGPLVIPPDVATCAACRAEVDDPADRRHGYAFTNCTDCGPRFTIVRGLPYDRCRTTMQAFTMCAACAAEYANPSDRRFHAQPNACPACGPQVWYASRDEARPLATRPAAGCIGAAAITSARERLRAGAILAVKGVGGFHLVCDATNEAAVQALRRRKRRHAKPLAVMVSDLAAAHGVAHIDEQERLLFEGPARPIVLVRRRGHGAIAPAVAPGTDVLGVMLPYAPLHHLLCAGLPPLVMTSGNVADEPIEHDNLAAIGRLATLVDGFLLHDRGIHVPCDDSVVRAVGGATLPVRCGRGFAPLPIRLPGPGRTVLAVGGDLKATLCVAHGGTAVMSQHLGDLAHPESLTALERTADHMLRLCAAEPDAVACDLHPGSFAAAWAARYAAARGIPLVRVQHHEAHVAALLADQAAIGSPLIGVCCDGTGFGHDGTVWGGEFFTMQHGAVAGHFRRAAHLDTFPLPGGDAAIAQPWRTALALLAAAGVDWVPGLAPVAAAGPAAANLRRLLASRSACPVTSSMGRLFDAVASLAGVRQAVAFEAEAALHLETLAAATADADGAYRFAVPAGPRGEVPLAIDWRPVIVAVAADALAGVAPAVIAARFHSAVAAMIVEVCRRLRDATGIGAVGLTGGVFQNAWLTQLVLEELRADRFDALVHGRVPPNDGGLALGQAVLARD